MMWILFPESRVEGALWVHDKRVLGESHIPLGTAISTGRKKRGHVAIFAGRLSSNCFLVWEQNTYESRSDGGLVRRRAVCGAEAKGYFIIPKPRQE
jgi:hypothetical protein